MEATLHVTQMLTIPCYRAEARAVNESTDDWPQHVVVTFTGSGSCYKLHNVTVPTSKLESRTFYGSRRFPITPGLLQARWKSGIPPF